MIMTSATPAKFTFDLDLNVSAEKSISVSEQEMAAQLKQVEQEAYAKGLAHGEASVTSKAAKALSSAATNLANHTHKIIKEADESRTLLLADATLLAVSTARKLATNLLAREPLAEIEVLLKDCLSTLESVPHLVIRCHPELADGVQELAEQQMSTSGFSGRLIVMGEPEIALGDAKFEWVEGGLVRDINKISEEIDARISAFFETKGIAPSPEQSQDDSQSVEEPQQ